MTTPTQRAETRLTRKSKTGATDRYGIDPSLVPAGMTYEWKRKTFLGKEDSEHQLNLTQDGWKAVPAERHTELATGKGEIVRGGLVLMERPTYLTEEARAEERGEASSIVASQMQKLTGGIPDLPAGFDRRPTRLNKGYERTSIPDDPK